MQERAHIPAGTRFGGDFTLLHTLGAGAYATVYEAREETLGGEVYAEFLRTLLSEAIPKVTSDLKDLIRSLAEAGYPANGFIFDTALAEYLLDATASDYAPKILCLKYFQREMGAAETLYRVYPKQKEYPTF